MKKEIRDFKKQEFKDILEHLDALEKKVETLLDVYVNSPMNSFNSADAASGSTDDNPQTVGPCSGDTLAPGSTIRLETKVKSKSPSFPTSNLDDTPLGDSNADDTTVGGICATNASEKPSVSDASTSPLFLLANAVTSSASAASNFSPQSSKSSGINNSGFSNGTGNLNRSSSTTLLAKRGLHETEQNGLNSNIPESDAKRLQLLQNTSTADANRFGLNVADNGGDHNSTFPKRASGGSDSASAEHDPTFFNINTDGSTATVGSAHSFTSSSSPNLSTIFFKPLSANKDYVWSQIRKGIPEKFHQEFDTLDLKIIENNKAKQEIVNKMIENPKIEEIPDIKIVKELLNISINKLKLNLVIPIEDYDVIGILQKWKTEGYNSLNNSYLLILNVLCLMSCEILLNFLQSGDDAVSVSSGQNGACGMDSKCITAGIVNQELLDTEWLIKNEEIFLGNSLLYCQSISLFPDGLASVQGILALLIYLPVIGVNLGNALLLSTAVRIAQDLGLHSELFSEAIKNNKRLREKKIRIWWFCCFIDEMISTSLMKPHLILKYNTTVTFKARNKAALLDIADEHCRKTKKNGGGFSMNGVDIDDNGSKINNSINNDEYLQACEVRENLIKYVYSSDGITPILRHYAFKFSQVFFQNSGRFQTSTPADIYKDVMLQISECFEDLPNLIKNHEMIDNNFPQEESFFIYILNLYFIEAQNTCSQGLYDLNNEKYVEFLKGLLKLNLKLSKFQTFYLFQEMDCMYFINFIKVIEYNINFEKNLQTFMENYQFLRDFVSNIFNVPLTNDGSLGESIYVKNDWRRAKYELLKRILSIMKEVGDMRAASAAS